MLTRYAFGRCERGGVAIYTGLVFILLVAAAGGAVDFANATSERKELQRAADAAVLAASAIGNGKRTAEDRRQIALDYMRRSDICTMRSCATPRVHVDGTQVTLEVDVVIPTTLLGVVGWGEIDIGVTSSAVPKDGNPVEVTLVLDYSSSMEDDDKYVDLRSAARGFVEQARDHPGDYISIALVPFATYVMAPMEGRHLIEYDVSTMTAGSPLTGANYVACMVGREHPYSTSSDEPSDAMPGSLWATWNYLPTTYNPSASTIYGLPPDVSATDVENGTADVCPEMADSKTWVRPLTKSFGDVLGALDEMVPASGTNISAGMDMAYHVMMPGEPYDQTVEAANLYRAVVLLSDGDQTIPASGPGGVVSEDAGDAVTAELCANMKDDGITIFTIALQVEDDDTRTMLQSCASDPAYYHEPAIGAQLDGVFSDIFAAIAETDARLVN